MQFSNPVVPGFHPDPSVCRVGEDYYLATSSFEYTPGIPLYHSHNLADWEPIGHCLTRPSQLPLENASASEGIFAPTLRYHDGTYYVISTNVSDGGHFVVSATDPRGEWSEPTWIDAPGIDPDLFWDDDTVYVTYREGEAGIAQAELDLETGALGESRVIADRLAGDYTEAPHLYEIDGTYYLVVAEGGTHTGHMVCVARSDRPDGPFEPCPDNPVLSHRGVSEMYTPIQATGHGDLIEAHDGTWWLVFLGIRQFGGYPGWHHLGRETFLAPVEWVDGWPVVNGGERITPELSVPDTDLERAPRADWTTTDPFAGTDLGPEWNGRYARERYTVGDGVLSLEGGPETLEERGVTFVGRRQQHLECTARARLEFDPRAGEEAGLTLFYDERHHYALALTRREGERRVVVRLRIGDATAVVADRDCPAGAVDLTVEGTPETYRFGFEANGSRTSLASASTRYLSTEVAGGFTGVYVGLYATGHGSDCEEPARFTAFEYRPLAD
ncbi:glycoside hydrolase family 43 protein [Natronobiforma cellulositropha]|uniref:glycoside hydrolase family 43 protein n=1 Tax=Natronobiforma cellulositropha TaxID=1679076 RepID=UPI0021D57047|nr:glycoside hydrolase family 43 protein [Natronobiforma cellulositropha]